MLKLTNFIVCILLRRIICCAPHENALMQFTDKARPRATCANAQFDQDFHCLLTESMDIVEHVDEKRMSIPGVMVPHAHLDLRCSQMAKMPLSHVAHHVLICHKDHSFKIMVCSPHDTRDHHVASNFASFSLF